jgi:hypothetical protein
MVAYSFKARFERAILDGRKRQTVRADRKRHARPGEPVQLYRSMRTKSCKLLGVAPCTGVSPIRIDVAGDALELHGVTTTRREGLDAFAQQDGFADWSELKAFWIENHPGVTIFAGWVIYWGPLQ